MNFYLIIFSLLLRMSNYYVEISKIMRGKEKFYDERPKDQYIEDNVDDEDEDL